MEKGSRTAKGSAGSSHGGSRGGSRLEATMFVGKWVKSGIRVKLKKYKGLLERVAQVAGALLLAPNIVCIFIHTNNTK